MNYINFLYICTMRTIKYIVVHCTATSKNTTIDSLKSYWKNVLGWQSFGYHYIIDSNGIIHHITPDEQIANGVKGNNQESIHLSYIGGQKKDDRNQKQKATMLDLISKLKIKYPNAMICGHRDFPGVKKACPQFNAKDEYNF